jgi:hypothetical protein
MSTACLAVCDVAANASPVTYQFSGTVQFGSTGQALVGTFDYDPATPGSGGVFPTAAVFHFSLGSTTGLTALVESIHITNGEALLGDPDRLSLGGTLPAFDGTFFNGYALSLEFFDPTGTAFNSDVLPLVLPPPSAFGTTTFLVRGFIASIEFEHSSGPVDSFAPQVAATPLPAALPLFTTGLCGLGFLMYRRHRRLA